MIEETCTVCGAPNPRKAVITATHDYPVCESHVGDMIGDMQYETVIDNF